MTHEREPSTLETLSGAAVSIISSIFAQEQQIAAPPAPVPLATALPALGGGTVLLIGAVVVFVLFFRK